MQHATSRFHLTLLAGTLACLGNVNAAGVPTLQENHRQCQ